MGGKRRGGLGGEMLIGGVVVAREVGDKWNNDEA